MKKVYITPMIDAFEDFSCEDFLQTSPSQLEKAKSSADQNQEVLSKERTFDFSDNFEF